MAVAGLPAGMLHELGWVEEYTVSANGTVVLAWNGAAGCLLSSAQGQQAPRPICPVGTADQVSPVARGERVAFLAADRLRPDAWRLQVLDLDTHRLARPTMAAGFRDRGVVWLDPDRVVTAEATADGGWLVLVPIGHGPSHRVLRLPGGAGWLDPVPSVAPDGRVALVGRGAHGRDLLLLDVDGGAVDVLLAGNRSAMPVAARWSPVGARLVVAVRRPRGSETRLIDLDAGTMELLDLPPLAELPAWMPAGQGLLVTVDEWPFRRVELHDPTTGRREPIPVPDGLAASAPQCHAGAYFFVASSPVRPPALWRWEPRSGPASLLAATPELPGLPPPRVLTLRSPSGVELRCLVHEPAAASEARATVLVLHGGSLSALRATWDPIVLCLTVMGYRVVILRTRGGPFGPRPAAAAEPGRFGAAQVQDVAACLGELHLQGLALPGRVAVVGHGHGAFVAYLASLRLARFIRAAVLVSGYLCPADLAASPDAEVRRFLLYRFGPELAAGPDKGRGVIATACPVQVVHGERDAQVPVAVASASAARLDGEGHELLVLPGEGNVVRRRSSLLRRVEGVLRFLEDHLA
jgi:pimeloyl-ACP methyl ester carboxylesterase